ncbi:MAG TPA: hypothetical protein VG929_11170 [Actinomycetota bacterium]|nr:hypothetical protein [Actinomycetota bacterium]
MADFERLPPDSPERWRALLGRKISIRYALTGDPEHPFSEAIGVVGSVTGEGAATTIGVVDRKGATTEIVAARVLQGKVFPTAS